MVVRPPRGVRVEREVPDWRKPSIENKESELVGRLLGELKGSPN